MYFYFHSVLSNAYCYFSSYLTSNSGILLPPDHLIGAYVLSHSTSTRGNRVPQKGIKITSNFAFILPCALIQSTQQMLFESYLINMCIWDCIILQLPGYII